MLIRGKHWCKWIFYQRAFLLICLFKLLYWITFSNLFCFRISIAIAWVCIAARVFNLIHSLRRKQLKLTDSLWCSPQKFRLDSFFLLLIKNLHYLRKTAFFTCRRSEILNRELFFLERPNRVTVRWSIMGRNKFRLGCCWPSSDKTELGFRIIIIIRGADIILGKKYRCVQKFLFEKYFNSRCFLYNITRDFNFFSKNKMPFWYVNLDCRVDVDL